MPSLVIDNGDKYVTAGFIGDTNPTLVLPNAVCTWTSRMQAMFRGKDPNQKWIANDTVTSDPDITCHYPLSNGLIDNKLEWVDLKSIWETIFQRLNVNPSECDVLMTCPVYSQEEEEEEEEDRREKMTQIMFEEQEVDRFRIGERPLFAGYANGRTTQLFVGLEDDVFYVAPVVEDYFELETVQKVSFGIGNVADYLKQLLSARFGVSVTNKEHTIRDILDTLGHAMINSAVPVSYELPNGTDISILNERYNAFNALFNPSLIDGIDDDIKGIHYYVKDAVQSVEAYYRPDMYKNIILSGSGMIYPGMKDRLKNEINNIIGYSEIKVDYVKNDVWTGGNILGSLMLMEKYEDMWITSDEYNENGPRIVHLHSDFAKQFKGENILNDGLIQDTEEHLMNGLVVICALLVFAALSVYIYKILRLIQKGSKGK